MNPLMMPFIGKKQIKYYAWVKTYTENKLENNDSISCKKFTFLICRYGSEIYKHAQHWSQTGVDSSWKFYEAGKFGQCPHPGFHYCLDQHVADGSIMFNEPVP